MSIPPIFIKTAKSSWNWQWNQLMNGLAPCDSTGSYSRPVSQQLNAKVPAKSELINRPKNLLPKLIIGRSCPWAHRTWLVFQIKGLSENLDLLIAKPNSNKGLWEIDPAWMGCKTLINLYKLCGISPTLRATVPALIDPVGTANKRPNLLGNESTQLIETLNKWPTSKQTPDLNPKEQQIEIKEWQRTLQESINNGVYKCGFARNQNAYNLASEKLFNALEKLEQHLLQNGPWICGERLTLADIRLFPTLIRWESIYQPLFSCSAKPLSHYQSIYQWRKRFFKIPKVRETCNAEAWRNDYFGVLFPLRPSNIIPNGQDIAQIIN